MEIFFSLRKVALKKITSDKEYECHQNDKDFTELISLTNRIKVSTLVIKLNYKYKCMNEFDVCR